MPIRGRFHVCLLLGQAVVIASALACGGSPPREHAHSAEPSTVAEEPATSSGQPSAAVERLPTPAELVAYLGADLGIDEMSPEEIADYAIPSWQASQLGRTHMESGRFAEAIDAFADAPYSPREDRLHLARALFETHEDVWAVSLLGGFAARAERQPTPANSQMLRRAAMLVSEYAGLGEDGSDRLLVAAKWLSEGVRLFPGDAEIRRGYESLPAEVRAQWARLAHVDASIDLEVRGEEDEDEEDEAALVSALARWMFARTPLSAGLADGCQDFDHEGREPRGLRGVIYRRCSAPIGQEDAGLMVYADFGFFLERRARRVRLIGTIALPGSSDCSTGEVVEYQAAQWLQTGSLFVRQRTSGWEYMDDADVTDYADICDMQQRRCTTRVMGRRVCRAPEGDVQCEVWQAGLRLEGPRLIFRPRQGQMPASYRNGILLTSLFASPTAEAGSNPSNAFNAPNATECYAVVADPQPPTNVRAGPESSHPVVGVLQDEQRVQTRGRTGGWTHVTHPVDGWIFSRLLRRVCEQPAQ